MTPEAKDSIESIRDYILKTKGATSDAIEVLEGLWQTAVDAKDISQSTLIGQEIDPKKTLNRDLTSSVNEVVKVLIKHGLEKTDIPLPYIQGVRLHDLEPAAFIPQEEEEKIWIKNTDALILGMIIEKNKKGEFVYDDLVEIGLKCMKEEYIQRSDSRNRASIRAGGAKRSFAIRIHTTYKNSGCAIRNMKQLIETAIMNERGVNTFKLNLVSKPKWRDVYKTIIEEYEDMAPKDFAIEVLSRFKESPKLEDLFIDAVEDTSTLNEKAVISNEVVEIILGNKFLDDDTANRLIREIMTDETSEQIKKQFGFYLSRVPEEKIRESQEQASSERSKKEISKDEHDKAIKLICYAIEKLTTEGKRGWTKIPKTKNRLSLKLLYTIASNAKGKCFEIQNILFPRVKITTQHDFIVKERKKIT